MVNKKRLIAGLAAAVMLVASAGVFACTNVLVGKNATADGSVITSWTDDSGSDNTKLKIVPAADWAPGSMRTVLRNTDYGEYERIGSPVFSPGEIPQVAHTYAYLDASYSFMNEKGVMIAESTIGGRSGMASTINGYFDIVELQRVALERSATARECVETMGKLAEQYGFAIGGESLQVIDANECWQFEVWGGGTNWEQGSATPGAVWVAARIPDDAVGVCANRARVGRIDITDTKNYMASPNIYSYAIDKGWWSPESGKVFRSYELYGYKAYSPYNARREWRVLSLVAPSLNLDPNLERYPFTVKPDKKVSVQDVMAICRDHYEGTEFDLTKGLAAGPFGDPNRWPASGQPAGTAGWERAISLFRTNFTTISQARAGMPVEIGSLTWVGLAAPQATCFVPVYAGVTKLPESYNTGRRGADYDVFARESAWWAFNAVANICDIKYMFMIKDVQAKQVELEGQFLAAQSAIETAAVNLYKANPKLAIDFITNYTNQCANLAVQTWWDLASFLMGRYTNGYTYGTVDKYQYTSSAAYTYPKEWLTAVGFGLGVSLTPGGFGFAD